MLVRGFFYFTTEIQFQKKYYIWVISLFFMYAVLGPAPNRKMNFSSVSFFKAFSTEALPILGQSSQICCLVNLPNVSSTTIFTLYF